MIIIRVDWCDQNIPPLFYSTKSNKRCDCVIESNETKNGCNWEAFLSFWLLLRYIHVNFVLTTDCNWIETIEPNRWFGLHPYWRCGILQSAIESKESKRRRSMMDFECQERHACVESIFLDNDDTSVDILLCRRTYSMYVSRMISSSVLIQTHHPHSY